MPHVRRSVLTILMLAAVTTALKVFPGSSSAFRRPDPPEPGMLSGAPQPPPDPNLGEPDSGSSRSQQTPPHARYGIPDADGKFAVRALRIIRWSSWIWAKRALGVGN